MATSTTYHPVLFFDGECNLCNSTVQLIIRHDRKKRFMFAPLQSAAGRRALAAVQSEVTGNGSVILLHHGRYYTRSAAVLQVFRLLGGAWSLLYAGIIIPAFIRNGIYSFVARHRYHWFGRRTSCMVPTPELSARFLP